MWLEPKEAGQVDEAGLREWGEVVKSGVKVLHSDRSGAKVQLWLLAARWSGAAVDLFEY